MLKKTIGGNTIRKKYPLAAEKLCKRAMRYNEGVELAKQYEKKGVRSAKKIKDFLNQ